VDAVSGIPTRWFLRQLISSCLKEIVRLSYPMIGLHVLSTEIWSTKHLGLMRGKAFLETSMRDVKESKLGKV
jgi:hypothetical protein